MDTRQDQDIRLRHIGEGRKAKPFLPLVFVQRRGLLILALGGLLSLACSLLVQPFVRPTYAADALLRLDPAKEPTLDGRERDMIPGNLGDYSRTLVARIAGYDVAREAVSRMPATNFPAFLEADDGPDRNVYRLISRVKIMEVPRSYLISARITAPQPDGLGPALNTLLEVFIERIQREQEQQYVRRLSYLREERQKMVERIAEQREALLALADTVESKSFLHEAYTAHLTKAEQIQRLYWEAEAVRADKASQLKRALRDQELLAKLDQQPFADERVADNFGINRIEQWTYEQLQSLRANIDGLTPQNADRQYIEARMKAMNEYLTTYKSRVNDETIRNLREKRTFELESEVIKARSVCASATETAQTLAAQLECARTESSAVSEAIFQAANLSFAVGQLRTRLAALDNRIDDCELEAKAPVRISIDKYAVTPQRTATATTNRVTLLALALAFGFGSVLVIVMAFDLLDNRIRTPRELELALGAPGPDPIASYVSSVSSDADFARATLAAHGHGSVHAIRELAVRLNFECERGGRVFVFCGLNPRCGVTRLAINTAHALTALRKPVVLLETNVARPGLAAALGLPPGPGLETALREDGQPWAELTRTDSERGLRALPAEGGGRPPAFSRIADILREAREADTTLIVDAGCVLDDDMSYFTAIHADAVILVARQDVSQYRRLRQTIDRMVQAGVPALTAILNDSRPLWLAGVFDRVQRALSLLTRLHQGACGLLRRRKNRS